VTRFIAFSIGMPVAMPSGLSNRSTRPPVAFTTRRAPTSTVRLPSVSPALTPVTRLPSTSSALASTWFASTAPCSAAASAKENVKRSGSVVT
jgi:hypothetical protein